MDARSTIRQLVTIGVLYFAGVSVLAQRVLTGVVLDERQEAVLRATVTAEWESGSTTAITSAEGAFSIAVPSFPVTLVVSARFIAFNRTTVTSDPGAITLHIRYAIPRAEETLVITANPADPAVDRGNDAVYKKTLFLRDDQLIETLDSGINAGQHEGGGKSLEFRRFGFNLDHGGLNGGLKVLIDDIPQNQTTQGHGQGYLGSLKSLTPELVEDVDIVNGPFRAEYGDFSALGAIHIRLKERLDDALALRAQGGSFGSYRTFAAWSPQSVRAERFLAWEHAYTDGPFVLPLHYTRDNITGNYTRRLENAGSLGFKFNAARNDFDSSGQIPLDLVAGGALNRFGYIDPSDGGKVRSGTAGVYWKHDIGTKGTLRLDGFGGRSLFDLFSDFTYFLNDPVDGDGIQQHDSRLQDGGSAQYLRSTEILGVPALLTAGANLADNRIAVDLFHQKGRHIIAAVSGDPSTEDYVHILNPAVYAQEAFEFPHLHLDAGLRLDTFRFAVTDQLNSENTGVMTAAAAEPKLNLVYTPDARVPLALHLNFGRATTSQDARGMALDPHAPRAAATNFYMLGTSHQLRRFAASTSIFLIDRQHEDVYDPDNGTMQFQGPSRSYGWEVKASARLAPHLKWNGGLTQVANAFYLGTAPRQYVDSAPHSVGNASITADGWRGLFASLRYRHIGHYLLVNPADTQVPASPPYTNAARALATGLEVLDFAATKKLPRGLEASLAIDNVNDKRYDETQNLFDSRVTPAAPAEARVHGTPGYPLGFTAGLTWRFEEPACCTKSRDEPIRAPKTKRRDLGPGISFFDRIVPIALPFWRSRSLGGVLQATSDGM